VGGSSVREWAWLTVYRLTHKFTRYSRVVTAGRVDTLLATTAQTMSTGLLTSCKLCNLTITLNKTPEKTKQTQRLYEIWNR
jgi:hypothetical protein